MIVNRGAFVMFCANKSNEKRTLCIVFQIKTLRLATSYITYLNRVLEGDQDPSSGFRAELVPSSRKINAERRAKLEAQVIQQNSFGAAERLFERLNRLIRRGT